MNGDEEQEQAALRAGMRELADGEQAGPAPVEAVIREGRTRRRRTAAAVGGVLLCAVAAALVPLGPTAGGDRPAAPAAPAVGASAPATPPAPPPPRRTVTPGEPSPADPGADAVTGRAYPVDWPVHCGLGRLAFAGRTWLAGTVVGIPAGLPGPRGPGSGPPLLPGYATLTGPDRLRFEAPGYLDGPVELTPVADAPGCA
ncbi:hypothetical protein OG389_36170 (plasmid) [Streptomyces sp. NBC_00435]|uniref:hypothetical protein n=1 Tax=Streptomyces sp. NBC_00435 TaxID=2903649 RepID=UPI002E1D33C4